MKVTNNNYNNRVESAVEAVKSADRISVLTGAGMAVESGIAPFRGEGGLWEEYDAEKYASIRAFTQNPERSWELFKVQIEEVIDADPHSGYKALVELESHGVDKVITQNIDGLHQKAGSSEVLELHGTLRTLYCVSCGKCYGTSDFLDEIKGGKIPRCECGEITRPDAVLFGEQLDPDIVEESLHSVHESDLMMVIGTSAVVQPAASFPKLAKSTGSTVIEINLESTNITGRVSDIFLEGKAGEILTEIVNNL